MKKISVLIFILFISFSYSQKYNKAYLQKQNKQLRSQIAALNKSLSKTKKETKNSYLYVVQLNDKIKKRARLIANTKKEKQFIEDDIYLKQLEVNKLTRELKDLRKNYGEVLIKAYKNKSVQNKILFVLTSKDLGQAYRRIKYLKLYSDYQDEKAIEIRKKIAEIQEIKKSREKDIKEKEFILAQQKEEVSKLDAEKAQKQKIVSQFKKNEGSLVAQIAKKQQQSNKIEADIQKAIKEEIEIARKKEAERLKKLEEARLEKERLAKLEAERKRKEAEAAALANKNKNTPPIETPKPVEVVKPKPKTVVIPKSEYAELSEEFQLNKGKLPKPLAQSYTITPFGVSKHPITGITLNTKYIELASANRNSKAKAVFNGRVTRISKAGGLWAVMISHGEYFTTYLNIDNVFIKEGDKVTTGQELGHIFINEENLSVLKFYVSKKSAFQNPSMWIR